MYNQYDDNINNLDNNINELYNRSKKIKKIRMISPVIIQSYGNNNFAIELMSDIGNRFNPQYVNQYNFIRNQFKNKFYKTSTDYSQLTPDKNNAYFISHNDNSNIKFYKNYTNINNDYIDNFYIDNNNTANNYIYNNYIDNNFINKNISYISDKKGNSTHKRNGNIRPYNYRIYKKEGVNKLFYPSEKKVYPNQKLQTELKHQRFKESYFPKNNKLKKKIFFKKIKVHKNNDISLNKRESSLSKSKIHLDEFNIDKLKEIGDNFAQRCISNLNQQKIKNLKNKKSFDNVNSNILEKKEKENGFINNMIIIEKKRKNSRIKMNLNNRNENNSNNKINSIENEKIKYIINLNNNHKMNIKNKIIKINRNKNKLNEKSKLNLKKIIKINNNSLRNTNRIYNFNSFNKELDNSHFIIENNTNKNRNRKKRNKEQNFCPLKLDTNNNDSKVFDTSNYFINKTFFNNNINNDIIKPNKKIFGIDIDTNKSEEFYNLKRKSSNHTYLERINIKNQKKSKITQHSFKNIFLP